MSTRRLAAIMFTDIVGYTALMQEDEGAALESLSRYKSCLEQAAKQHEGEIIQYYGDGCLLVFPSAVQAAHCGEAMQRSFRQAPGIPVRIGIHMGDILEKEGNIFGDAVNVASRVESMGVPGSVLLSHPIYESIKSRGELPTKALGSFQFKNVKDPLEVYALTSPDMRVPQAGSLKGKFAAEKKRISPILYWAAALLIVLAVGGGILMNRTPSQAEDPYIRLLVMPFDVQGSESIQYLGRGMVDLLSTKLDGIGAIRTLDPNMIFSVLGDRENAIRDPKLATKTFREHQAERVVLGNVVQLGKQLRFSASLYDESSQLIDRVEVITEDETQLPSLIDELARKLISQELETEGEESASMAALSTGSLDALKAYLEGETFRRNGQFTEAFSAYETATKLDPGFALAWSGMFNIQAWGRGRGNERFTYAQLDSLAFKLPPKQQLLKKGWDAFKSFDFDRLETIYQQGIKEYGEDVELLRLYGEYLFHANMHNLRSQIEAKPYFLKALKYQPDNQELRTHLFQIYAMEGNVPAVDSMAALTSPLANNWPSIRMMQLLVNDSLHNRKAFEEVVSHKYFSPSAVWQSPGNGKNLIPFDTLAREIFDIAQPAFPRRVAEQEIILRGMRGRTKEDIAPVSYFRMALLLHRFMGEPNFALFQDHYERMQAALLEREDRLSMYEQYVLTTYHILLRDEARYRQMMEMFESLQGQEEQEGPVQAVLYICKTYWHRNHGENEMASLYIDSLLHQTVPVNINTTYDMNMGNIYLIKAEILFEQGKYEQAIDWYQTIFELRGTFAMHSALASYRLGKCYEETGREEEALKYYDYFTDLYQDADPRFQNWLSDARNSQERIQLREK